MRIEVIRLDDNDGPLVRYRLRYPAPLKHCSGDVWLPSSIGAALLEDLIAEELLECSSES